MSKGAGPIPTQPGGQERQTVPADAAAWHPPQKSGFERAVEGVGKAVRRHGPKVALSIGLTRIAFGAGEVNTVPDFQAAVAIADRGRAPITREIKGKHGGNHDSGVTTKTSGDDGKGTPGFSPTDGKGKRPLMTVWSSRNPGPNSAAIAEFRSGREPRGKEPVVNGQRGNQTADRFFRPPSHSVQEVLNRGNDQGDVAEAFFRGLFFGRFITGCAVQAPTTLVYETVQSERPSPLPTATLTLDQGNSDQAHLVSFETDKVLQNKVTRFQEATRELLYRQFGDKSYTKWEITYTVDDASYNNLKRDQFPSFFVTNLTTGERYAPAFWGEPGNIGFVAVPERAEWHRVTSTQDDSSFLGPHEPTMVYMDDMDALNGRPIPRVYNRDIGAYLDFNLIPDFSAQDEERFVQTFVDAFNANRSALRNIAEEQHGLDTKDNPQKIVAFSPVYRPDGSVRFLLEDQTRGGRQEFIIRSDGKKVYVPETPEDDKSPESNKKQWRRVLDPVNGVYSYEKQVWNGDEYTWEVIAVFMEDSGPLGEVINLSLLRPAQPEGIVSTTTPVLTRPSDQQVTPNPESPTPDLKSPTPQPPTQELSPTPDNSPTPQVDTPVPPSPTEDVELLVTPKPPILTPKPPTREATPIPRLPELKQNGWTYEVEGKPVILRGAVLPHLTTNLKLDPTQSQDCIKDIERLKELGINSVSIYWNLGEVSNPKYVDGLLKVVQEAQRNGMRVIFAPHSNGFDENNPFSGKHMLRPPPDYMQRWEMLFDYPGAMDILASGVDVISLVAEYGEQTPWSDWRNESLGYISPMRERFKSVGKHMQFAVSLPEFASNPTGVLENPITDPDVGIDFHPYPWVWDKYAGTPNSPDEFVRAMRAQNRMVILGEMGPMYDQPFEASVENVLRTLRLMTEFQMNGMWFAAWTEQDGSGHLFKRRGVVSKAGELVFPYLTP